MLLTTGRNDPRLAPWQPAKMTARLQAATSSGRPVLLRVEDEAGHGVGSTADQRDAELADELAFLLHQLVTSTSSATGGQHAGDPLGVDPARELRRG